MSYALTAVSSFGIVRRLDKVHAANPLSWGKAELKGAAVGLNWCCRVSIRADNLFDQVAGIGDVLLNDRQVIHAQKFYARCRCLEQMIGDFPR